MDGTAAISSNLEALKRILAGLFAVAGFAGVAAFTLPRHLRLAILQLLRPAESAARRLIIASARGLVVTLPPPGKPRPKPATVEPQLRRFGIAVVMSPDDIAGAAASILPRSRGRGTGEAGGGGGPPTADPHLEAPASGEPRRTALPLFDPPRRFRPPGNRTVPAHAAPRILFPGSTVGPHPEVRAADEPRRTPSPDDPVDAMRLALRLAALAAALEDLPGQAKRFARWKAARDALILPCEAGEVARRDGGGATGARDGRASGRIRRTSPLRPGRPPGGRLARFDPSTIRRRNIREVDEILAHAHALALYALENPDTS